AFFFSSERRHTRCPRDGSSAVCSSDLTSATPSWGGGSRPPLRARLPPPHDGVADVRGHQHVVERVEFREQVVELEDVPEGAVTRSEERRVGKWEVARGCGREVAMNRRS